MAKDPAMVCKCCGHWRVILIKINSGERQRAHQILRITSHDTLVREVHSVEQVDKVLQEYGIDIADFVPEDA